MSKGTLLVLTGASSVGKGAIRDCLLEDDQLHLFYSISMTTRPKKDTEKDGVDYYFVNRKTFADAVRSHELLEYTQFDGYYYVFLEGLAEDIMNGDSCLVEGTKIKTIDGYKNIEDIRYDDLLATWSYDLGKIVYEYPIWIEKEDVSDYYQKTTFSDGTVLKTVGFHGVYSYDLNKFVSVDDKDNFKVGTNVAMVDNGDLKKITVTDIEIIEERVKFYHVESTRYYNIISNNIITTDGYVELTNLYDFNSNITWSGNEEILKDKNNLYSYNELNMVPYYLYKGLRMKEAKHLVNNNVITKEELINILNSTMLNETETLQPIMKNGSRYWMVTLETDKMNDKNKGKYLKKEGSTYVLPKDDDVKYWYNSSDNTYYKPGSKVKVYHGMHFTKIEK